MKFYLYCWLCALFVQIDDPFKNSFEIRGNSVRQTAIVDDESRNSSDHRSYHFVSFLFITIDENSIDFHLFLLVLYCRTEALMISKLASNLSLNGPEYMWIFSSVVLCKFNFLFSILKPFQQETWVRSSCSITATYSNSGKPKISPYDNPNRRKMDFLSGTLGLFTNSIEFFVEQKLSLLLILFFCSFVQRRDLW